MSDTTRQTRRGHGDLGGDESAEDQAAAWIDKQQGRYHLRPSGNGRALYEGTFFVGRLRETKRYWNVYIKDSSLYGHLADRFGPQAGVRMVRLDAKYHGTTILVDSSALHAVLEFVAAVRTVPELSHDQSSTRSDARGRHSRASDGVTTARHDSVPHVAHQVEASSSSEGQPGGPRALGRDIRQILRAAGSCPLRQQAELDSPCREYCKLGLREQYFEGTPYQWVTALGWGDANSELYILGTTPKFHSPAERWGPNYAAVEANRDDHAEWFATRGFEEFQAGRGSDLAPTTSFTQRLIAAWHGATGRTLARAFVAEMMVCPQHNDPVGEVGVRAMRHCFEQNLGRLLALPSQPKWLITIGAKHVPLLGKVLGVALPRPTRQTPVTSRNLLGSHRAGWIGVVSPAGGGGGPWDDLIAQVLQHRDQFQPARPF